MPYNSLGINYTLDYYTLKYNNHTLYLVDSQVKIERYRSREHREIPRNPQKYSLLQEEARAAGKPNALQNIYTHNFDVDRTPVGENFLNRGIENTVRVRYQWKQNPRCVLFSANGFTDALQQRAAKEGVHLIEANDLF